MIGNKDLYGEFGKFGYCDITTLYTPFRPVPVEAQIRIILDVSKVLPADASPTHVRTTMTTLAEVAIAYAEKHYRLIDAPRIEIDGHCYRQQFVGEAERDPIIVTKGMLVLRIADREEAQ